MSCHKHVVQTTWHIGCKSQYGSYPVTGTNMSISVICSGSILSCQLGCPSLHVVYYIYVYVQFTEPSSGQDRWCCYAWFVGKFCSWLPTFYWSQENDIFNAFTFDSHYSFYVLKCNVPFFIESFLTESLQGVKWWKSSKHPCKEQAKVDEWVKMFTYQF